MFSLGLTSGSATWVITAATMVGDRAHVSIRYRLRVDHATLTPDEHQEIAAQDKTAVRRVARGGKFRVRGGIVGPGTLVSNQARPGLVQTPERRLATARLALGQLILRIVDAEPLAPVKIVNDAIEEE